MLNDTDGPENEQRHTRQNQTKKYHDATDVMK